jgi:phage host-nuclease inhibitor protein Gam
MGRPKKASVELSSIEDANRALRALLLAEVELERQVGALDIARAEATSKFEKPIDKQKAVIADLTLQLQTWYMSNHDELERDGAKSLRLTFGVIGRRLGRPSLKPLNRSWTWASIAVKLRSVYSSRFFHAPEEPKIDRERARQELTIPQLKDCGLRVDQEETFFVETDRSTLGEAGASAVKFLIGWLLLMIAAAALGILVPLWMENLR